ncbi:MAG: protein kinase [Phycisphaerae bacterium]
MPQERKPDLTVSFAGVDETQGSPVAPLTASLDETIATPRSDSSNGAGPGRVAQRFPSIDGYQITGVLGQGGMGIVYRAVQIKLNRTVALKVLPAIVSTANPTMVSRFRREAEAAARLHHTNIIPIYDYGESSDGYYYAMELVVGKPLDELIHHFSDRDVSTASPVCLAETLMSLSLSPRPQPVPQSSTSSASLSKTSPSGRGRAYFRHVTRWMADAADALHYAHGQGIIHRDIKPANLVLSEDGRIMVADFGLAKKSDEHSMTMTGSIVGTLRYVSPEQAMARRVPVDHRTDVYSLGATMYELLCFARAHPGEEEKEILGAVLSREPVAPRKVNPAIPAELETICLKALEKSPDARYESAKALADDLRRYSQDLPIAAKRPGPVRRAAKFVRRHKALVITSTTAVLLVAVTVSLAFARTALREQRIETLRESAQNYALLNRWADAEADLTKALDLRPHDVDTLLYMTWLKLERFKSAPKHAGERALKDAEALCSKMLAIDPNHVVALNYYGVALRRLARYDEAITALEHAVKLEPEKYSLWSNLGAAYAEAGNLEKAAELLGRGADVAGDQRDTWRAAAWRNLAVLELHLQDDHAVGHIANAIGCDKDDALTWAVRARIRMELAGSLDLESALDDAKFADRAAGEENPKTKRVLALAYLRNRRPERAIEQSRLAIELGDMPAINHLVMALAEARRNNPIGAQDQLAMAEQTWPEALRAPGAFVARAQGSELWIESADELIRLREEVKPILAEAGNGRP